jgi:hypothetical protein
LAYGIAHSVNGAVVLFIRVVGALAVNSGFPLIFVHFVNEVNAVAGYVYFLLQQQMQNGIGLARTGSSLLYIQAHPLKKRFHYFGVNFKHPLVVSHKS